MSLPNDLQSRVEMAEGLSDDMKMYRYKGVLYPKLMCPEENLEAVEKMEAREDDVILVAYPKCGFNWMVGVLKKIIEAATGQKNELRIPPLIEFFGPDTLKVMDERPSPRFMGTHFHPDNIPKSFYEKKTKMLVIFRNPKDTMVSYYHFSNNNPVLPSAQSWDAYFSQFMSGDVGWGSYFDHAIGWDKKMDDPNVMVVTYEDLKQVRHTAVHYINAGLTLHTSSMESVQDRARSPDELVEPLPVRAASTQQTTAEKIAEATTESEKVLSRVLPTLKELSLLG